MDKIALSAQSGDRLDLTIRLVSGPGGFLLFPICVACEADFQCMSALRRVARLRRPKSFPNIDFRLQNQGDCVPSVLFDVIMNKISFSLESATAKPIQVALYLLESLIKP